MSTSVDVVSPFPNGLDSGLQLKGHKIPDRAGVHILAKDGITPAAAICGSGIHLRHIDGRGREKRETRPAIYIGTPVVEDANDAILHVAAVVEPD